MYKIKKNGSEQSFLVTMIIENRFISDHPSLSRIIMIILNNWLNR